MCWYLLSLAGLIVVSASAQMIENPRQAFTKARADTRLARQRAERLEAAAGTAKDEAAALRRREAALAARVQAAEADIDAAEARVAVIEQLRAKQRAALAQKQGPTIRLVAALQTAARRPAALALVQPGSVDDMVHIRAVLATMLPAIQARTAALRADVARSRSLRDAANGAVVALRTSQAALVTQRSQLAAMARARDGAADRLTGSALAEQDRAIALGEEARDLSDLMSKVDDAAARAAGLASLPGPVLRPADPSAAQTGSVNAVPVEPVRAPYRLPVVGQVVTGLGEISATGVRARGLTIATRPSAQVVAPTGGRIAFAGPYRGFGNIVIMDHGRGWTTLITSLSALDVKAGEIVDQGSPIGRAGRDRPTVTIELRRGGQPVDITRLAG